MTRTKVKSSNLASVGYDPTSQTMEVEFLNGAVHQYANVPKHHIGKILAADSPGSYFHQHIKGGGFHSKPA